MAVDASHLYWTNGGDGTIWRASLDGTSPQALVTGQNRPFGVAVDPSYLYWSNGDGTIWQANLDGTSPQSLASGQDGGAWGVAVSPIVGVG